MHLKRKRSQPRLSSPHSTSSDSSPPPSCNDNGGVMDTHPPSLDNVPDVHVHASGRTLKRYRDNRPSEEQVHQRTLKMLYSAQLPSSDDTQHTLSSRQDQHEHEHEASTASANHSTKQQSLHQFWTIRSAPAPSSSLSANASMLSAPRACEDCGARLGGGGGDVMDVDVDVDDLPTETTACVACGKHVCFGCSVSNLGEQMRCLRCAGRKDGGFSCWNNAGYVLC
ncbi:hypothetical protein E4U21_000445 [Claviceps maximensis]|nr:hypothetical protein E4U21_000445 [Claviceps maximensis]